MARYLVAINPATDMRDAAAVSFDVGYFLFGLSLLAGVLLVHYLT
jgi:hypothetical protein